MSTRRKASVSMVVAIAFRTGRPASLDAGRHGRRLELSRSHGENSVAGGRVTELASRRCVVKNDVARVAAFDSVFQRVRHYSLDESVRRQSQFVG